MAWLRLPLPAVFLVQFQVAQFQVAATAPPAPAPTPELRDAQARFESVRRMHMPILRAPPPRCDVRIGRFCYWYDSAPPPLVAEAHQTRDAREQLLALLDSAGRVLPHDPWIAGQRVRYQLDARRPADAARLGCGAEGWWCAALRGLALHVHQDFAGADSAFSVALAAMPPPRRCEWLDLSVLLDDGPAREIGRATCAERETLAMVAWRLSQPLWLTGGNDARSEHLARRTMDVILDGSAIAHGSRWGNDTRELLLRYGWSEVHTRSPPDALSAASWSVLGHDREPNWKVLPNVASLRTPWVDEDDWDLRAPLARSRYAPRHLTALLPLQHQLVRIPIGDSVQVAVAVRLSDQELLADTLDAALLFGVPGQPAGVRFAGTSAAFTVPADTVVVSIEMLGRSARRAARARYSLAPPPCSGAWCVSDLLLFEPEQGRDSLAMLEALDRAVTTSLRRDQPLGVWWHVRGRAGVPVTMRVSLEPARAGVLRRLAEGLRLTRSRAALRLQWLAVQRPDSASSQVVLRFPAQARGAWRVTLTVQPRGGAPVSASREIEILP